jgi:hypothetical protein
VPSLKIKENAYLKDLQKSVNTWKQDSYDPCSSTPSELRQASLQLHMPAIALAKAGFFIFKWETLPKKSQASGKNPIKTFLHQ